MMLAWSFYLFGFCFGAILFLICGLSIAIKKVRNIDCWRYAFVFSVSLLFCLLLIWYKENIDIKTIFFLLLLSLNIAYINEIFYKLKRKSLRYLFIIIFACFIVFLIVASLIPYSPLLPNYKKDLFIYIGLIFGPLLTFMSICLTLNYFKKSVLVLNK